MPLFGRSAMPRERRTARALAVFLVVSLQIFAQFTRESNRAPELGETKGSKRIGVQVAGRASLRGRLKGSNLASFLSSMVTDNKGAHHSSNQTVEEKKELDGISGVKKRAEATITIASRRAPRVLSRKHKIKAQLEKSKHQPLSGIDEFQGAPVYGKGGTITRAAVDDNAQAAAPGRDAPSELSKFGTTIKDPQVVAKIRSLVCRLAQCGLDIPFPGSQPVSLFRRNMALPERWRYCITWKADGTRALVLVMSHGVYLIDRSFSVTRTNIRFPLMKRPFPKYSYANFDENDYLAPEDPQDYEALVEAEAEIEEGKDIIWPPPAGQAPNFSGTHHGTLFDAELTLDRLPNGGTEPRVLIYDLLALNMRSVCSLPFQDRYKAIMDHLLFPRRIEKGLLASSGKNYTLEDGITREVVERHVRPVDEKAKQAYASEKLKVQRKQYWSMKGMGFVLKEIIPSMPHESDGIIIQPWRNLYNAGTDGSVLKWKFSGYNSVDLMFWLPPEVIREDISQVSLSDLSRYWRGEIIDSAAHVAFEGEEGDEERGDEEYKSIPDRLYFPPETTVSEIIGYNGKILEFTYDHKLNSWRFMKVRADKDLPNSSYSYARIKQSIVDAITETDLIRWANDPNVLDLPAGMLNEDSSIK
ncbi:hypothetical protein AAMO2058_000047700 [Amorphochlora amoebiformis]